MAIHMSQAVARFLFGGDLESKLNLHLKDSTFRLLILHLVHTTADSSHVVIRCVDYPVTTANFPCVDTVDARSVHPILRLLLQTVGVPVTVGNEKYSDVKYLVTGIDANYTTLITQAYKDSGGSVNTTDVVLQHKHLGTPIPEVNPLGQHVSECTLEELRAVPWVQQVMSFEAQQDIRATKPNLMVFHDTDEGGWGYITLIGEGTGNWMSVVQDKFFEPLQSTEVRKQLTGGGISFGIGLTPQASVEMAWLLYSVQLYPAVSFLKELPDIESWTRHYVLVRLAEMGIDIKQYQDSESEHG